MWTRNSSNFCNIFGLSLPIIQAPMAGGPSSPELVNAVSKLSCLGSIAAGYLSPEKLESDILLIKEKVFSVNVFIPPKDYSKQASNNFKAKMLDLITQIEINDYSFEVDYVDYLDRQIEVIIKNKVPILSFVFGLLSNDHIAELKKHSIKIIGTATNVEEARVLEGLLCDAIVVQGSEAGGHRGGFEDTPGTKLFSLLPQVLDAVKIPCIAAGGIMDGKDIANALNVGASAVQMGTAFLATKESGASREWKKALLQSSDSSTVQTRLFSGKLARGIRNKFITEMSALESEAADYPIQNEITKIMRAKAKELANPDFQSLWAGEGCAKGLDISVEDLIAKLVKETKDNLNDM